MLHEIQKFWQTTLILWNFWLKPFLFYSKQALLFTTRIDSFIDTKHIYNDLFTDSIIS